MLVLCFVFRFAEFIDNGHTGITEDELVEYENYMVNNDLIDEDNDEWNFFEQFEINNKNVNNY